jgi:hypothetical protein
VQLVSDLAEDGQINDSWTEYAGAAVGGAVTGGLLAACPTCGLAASFAISGLGGAVGNATTQGLKLATGEQQQFDLVDFGVETGVSAAFGLIPAGRGAKAAIKGKPQGFKAAFKNVFRFKFKARKFKRIRIVDQVRVPSGVPLPVPVTTRVPITARDAFGELYGRKGWFVLDVLTGFVEDKVGNAASGDAVVIAKRQIFGQSVREVNSDNRGVYGEFAHWQVWLDAMELAARALPNNPNNLLTAF